MNWLASLGVGIVSAPLAGLICGTAAVVCAEWARIPQREGAAGFFAVGMALLGAIIGLVLGILFARGVIGSEPTFAKALGLTLGTLTAISLVITAIVRVTADLPPKVEGRPVEMAIELRCPPGTAFPTDGDVTPYATLVRLSDGEQVGYATLEAAKAREEAGRIIVPVTLSIGTSASRKLVRIRLQQDQLLHFGLDFGSKPQRKDFDWSGWIDAGWDVNTPKPATEQTYSMRYQVRKIEPPPPIPTQAQQEAEADAQQEAALRALAPDAPLAQWLVYTRYGVPEARAAAVAALIRARPNFKEEMTHEMLDGEYDASRDALRALPHFQPPPTELADGVKAVANEIAQAIRDLGSGPPPADQRYENGGDISTRFSAWMEAARALQGKDGVDLVPQLQEIIEPARKHTDNQTMRIDVVRVASYYLQQWGGIAPLPSDPPPR